MIYTAALGPLCRKTNTRLFGAQNCLAAFNIRRVSHYSLIKSLELDGSLRRDFSRGVVTPRPIRRGGVDPGASPGA